MEPPKLFRLKWCTSVNFSNFSIRLAIMFVEYQSMKVCEKTSVFLKFLSAGAFLKFHLGRWTLEFPWKYYNFVDPWNFYVKLILRCSWNINLRKVHRKVSIFWNAQLSYIFYRKCNRFNTRRTYPSSLIASIINHDQTMQQGKTNETRRTGKRVYLGFIVRCIGLAYNWMKNSSLVLWS